MAKIGTAHLEIKPVLNEDALGDVTRRIREAVEQATNGMPQRVAADETVKQFEYRDPDGSLRVVEGTHLAIDRSGQLDIYDARIVVDFEACTVTYPLSADNPH